MRITIAVVQVLLLAAYAGAAFVYLRYYMTRARLLRQLCRPVLLAILALHTIYLLLLGAQQNWIPLVSPGHAMTVMVAAVTAMYLGVELRTHNRVMGTFVLGVALVFQLLSGFLSTTSAGVPDTLRSVRLPAHALPAIMGYAGLALGAVFSSLMLVLRGQIKRRRIGRMYRRLPSLRVLDTMGVHANVMGFALLSLGVLTGCVWAAAEWGSFVPRDPKVIAVILVWGLYGIYVVSLRMAGVSRRVRAIGALVAFAALTFSFTVLGLIVESRHNW